MYACSLREREGDTNEISLYKYSPSMVAAQMHALVALMGYGIVSMKNLLAKCFFLCENFQLNITHLLVERGWASAIAVPSVLDTLLRCLYQREQDVSLMIVLVSVQSGLG